MRIQQIMLALALGLVPMTATSCGFLLELPSIGVNDLPPPLPPASSEPALGDLQQAELLYILAPAALPAAAAGPVTFEFTDGAPDGLYLADTELPVTVTLRITSGAIEKPATIEADYRIFDFYGRPIAKGQLQPIMVEPEGPAQRAIVLEEIKQVGAYAIQVNAKVDGRNVSAVHPFGIIPAPVQVSADRSPFGVAGATRWAKNYARLGARHLLAYFADGRNVTNFDEAGDNWQPSFNRDPGAEAIQAMRDAGLELLPVIGFGPAELKSEEAKQASRERFGIIDGLPYGPPQDVAVFAKWAAGTVGLFAQNLKCWQIWRDPTTGGWTWAAGPTEFRILVTVLCRELKDRQVKTKLAFAATPETLEDAAKANWQLPAPLMCGLATYEEATASNLAEGEFAKSLAEAVKAARRLGIKEVYISETGESPRHAHSHEQAWKLIIRHAEALRLGIRRIYVQDNMGVRNPKAAAVAYAVLARTLAGKCFAKDARIESVENVNAPIFSDRQASVAILWSYARNEAEDFCRRVIAIDSASGIEAKDAMGTTIGIWDGHRLTVPLGEAPIYLVGRGLSASELADRLKRAKTVQLEKTVEEKTEE